MSIPPGQFSGNPMAGLGGDHAGSDFSDRPAAPGQPDPAMPVAVAAPDLPRLVEHPHPLTPVVRAWVLVAAAAWAIGRELVGREYPGFRLPPLNWVTVGGAVIVLGLLVIAYLDWRATSFIIDPSELRIESGVFVKTSERIRYDRIQAVDVAQPFLPRLLGMAEITIDVGAEGGHRLRYLSRQRAVTIREYLLARAHGVVAAPQNQVSTGALDDLGADDEVLVRVPPQRLLLGAVLSHEVLFGVVPFVAMIAWLSSRSPDGLRVVLSGWALFGLVLPALAGFWRFVARRVIGQWNYAFVRSGPGLKISRGLTNLTSQSVPRHRIQSLLIAQPLWWRRLGLYRVEMAVLGNAGLELESEHGTTSNILLPIGTHAEVDLVLATIWPGLSLDEIVLQRSPDRARWLQPISHRWVGWGSDDEVLVTQSGWLTRHRTIVPHARLQSMAVTQGPLRRRLGLASVDFHTTNPLSGCRASNIENVAARDLITAEVGRAKSSNFSGLVDDPIGLPDGIVAAVD